MERPLVYYNTDEFIFTKGSGNKISRKATVQGPNNIIVGGKVPFIISYNQEYHSS
jgi:hypothetical protein